MATSTNPAENKPPADMAALEARQLSRLKTAISARAWKAAEKPYEALRFLHSWTHARFAAEFGSERWEDIAEEMDAAESEDE